MNSKNILSSNAFWTLNKTLTQKINDVQSTFFLTYLIDKEDYHQSKGTLKTIDDKKWFFAVSSKVEEVTTLTYKQQKRCIKILESKNLLEKRLIGVPAKLHFTLSHNQIIKLVIPSIDQRDEQELTNEPDIIVRTESQKQSHKNKTQEQISEILLFFKEKTGRAISVEGVRSEGNRSLIKAILKIKQKPNIEEIKKVIELKFFEWDWNAEMSKYLQISTIFRKSNFVKYLEQLNLIESSQIERTRFVNAINAEKKKHGIKTEQELEATNRGKDGVGAVDSKYGF